MNFPALVMILRFDRKSVSVELETKPLVLCRDCKHWGEPFDKMNGLDVAHCDQFPTSEAFREVFFCGHGEQKGDK